MNKTLKYFANAQAKKQAGKPHLIIDEDKRANEKIYMFTTYVQGWQWPNQMIPYHFTSGNFVYLFLFKTQLSELSHNAISSRVF